MSAIAEEARSRPTQAPTPLPSAGLAPPAVVVRELVKRYPARGARQEPVVANDRLSFDIRRGEIFGLLGPNGAGKTTLVMQLMGLLPPTSGHLQLEHVDVVRDPQAAKELIGFLPQGGLALNYVEVERALHYTGRLRGQGEQDAILQAKQLIEELGLGDYRNQFVNLLSGGMARLVGFGMALMGRPRLLVLDEPTNELDPHRRRLVWDYIQRLNREQGVTCLLVTHNVLEAEQVIQRLAVMDKGRIIALGTPEEIKHQAGGRLRLELQLKEDARLTAEEQERLAAYGALSEVRPQHYRLQLAPERSGPTSAAVLQELGERVESLRLARPSLEEVYLELDRTRAETPAAPESLPPVPAPPPGPTTPSWRRFAVALKYLFLEHLLEVRHTWVWNTVFSILMPVAMVFGLSRIGSGLEDRTSLLYIVSGAAVFSVATEGLLTTAQRVGLMRQDGRLIYYASLPINQSSFVSSIILSRVLIIFPGILTPILAGWLLYGIRLEISPWLAVLVPLSALSFSALGMALGSLIRDLDLVVTITNAIISVLLLAAPVFIPMESLPRPLQLLGQVLPPTYAAEALRLALDGQTGSRFLLDVAVLAVVTALSFVGVSRWMRWRLD
ncbi:ABC transporter ATP-binding protein/permease [Hyalangium rubrum]|uniref:ABC transporter ATP-binding protein/permease n=1 Tax=Hyalangium rubrum TaxID=3103134 RepID=A0ABU5GVB4_9BACT|nr:ABC transporter ATP-binding protein/permease [Hyalangium sp. s54d21]MDY7225122.1 ABC transporter ATP-binding protein/permease [Hyalangium sp. s54d21]